MTEVMKNVMQAVGLLMESLALFAREVYQHAEWLSDSERHERILKVEHAREVLEIALEKLDLMPPEEPLPPSEGGQQT